MSNFVTSLVLLGLLFPSGFDFLTATAIDYSYSGKAGSVQAEIVPQRLANASFGLKTTARNILLIDDFSRKTLYEKNPNDVVPIASITKLMSALVFLDTGPDWNEVVTIEQSDQRQGGQVYLLTGEAVTKKDLFDLMLVSSSNEAAIALARSSGLDNFVAEMNRKAHHFGMADTYFIDPSGLAPANISSAKDLIKLARIAFSQPEISKALTAIEREFTVVNSGRKGKGINTDQLLESFLNSQGYKLIGAKTGYLNEAGYCLLLQVQRLNGPSLTLVLLGSETVPDRWQEAKGLIDWAISNYIWTNGL